jgi:benzoyl-CoA reductase/2-hydroxyglutaryl-CoA dehydratase subunit BcrC/BadD/HgdB
MIATQVDALLQSRRITLEKAGISGTKVVGFFPGGYVPEEMIYASGAIPLCLSHGGDARPSDEALSILPSVICPFARAQVGEMLLETNPFYSNLDLLVVPSTCQHMKKIGDVWEYYQGPQVFKLGVPYERNKDFELEYFRGRLVALKERLEAVCGNTITDDGLTEAIGVYNRLRALLKALSLTRRSLHPPISSLDFVRLNHASHYADPVAMVDVLETVYRGLSGAAPYALGTGATARDGTGRTERPRVLVTGPNLAFGDHDVLKMVADAGAEVVVEDIFEGVRDYWHSIDDTGDPIASLAKGYLIDKRPAAFMRGSTRERLEFVRRLIREFDVSGVLWYQLLCCEFYDEEAYFFELALRADGIPMLIVESDYHALDSGPLRTRLEAFVETLGGGPIDA